MWQIDCERFLLVGRPFELRDVETQEHMAFVLAFSQRNGLKVERDGATVTFSRGP